MSVLDLLMVFTVDTIYLPQINTGVRAVMSTLRLRYFLLSLRMVYVNVSSCDLK